MKKAFAIFDVDYTIISCDSMFAMLFFGIRKRLWTIIYLPIVVLKLILFAAGIIDAKSAKETIYFPIKFLKESELEEFFNEVLMKKLFQNVMDVLKYHKEEGRKILLVSASPEIYLKYFSKYQIVDAVIGTQLMNYNGKVINKIKGCNCKNEEKVKRIDDYLKKNNLKIDYENSFAYSDSKSDIPMLSLVKNRYKVNKKNGIIGEFVW